MVNQVSDRYVMTREVLRSTKGVLYSGKDLSLERIVYLYVANASEGNSPEKIMQQIADVSQSSDPRFVHILDMAAHVNSVYAVLEHREGAPLLDYLRQKSYSFREIIHVLVEVGNIGQGALQQKASGFSVLIDNLFMNSRNEVMVINYWAVGNTNERGVMGLLNLLYQLVTKKEDLPEDMIELHDQIKRAMGEMEPETTKKFLDLIQRAYYANESLTTFVEGLNQFVKQGDMAVCWNEKVEDKPARLTSNKPKESKKTEAKHKSTQKMSVSWKKWAWGRKGKWALGILAVVLVGSTIIHFAGKKQPAKTTPTTLVQPAAPVQPTNEQANQDAGNNSNMNPTQNGAKVPDLRGVPREAAEKSLLSLGLHYKYLVEKGDLGPGLVFKQDIAPGVQVDKGTTLTFWVSK
jgi:eukaryotic-like serine/threonine-protein kinase